MARNSLFKAGNVVWCGTVGYALREVARATSLNREASSWPLSLHMKVFNYSRNAWNFGVGLNISAGISNHYGLDGPGIESR